MRKKRRNKFDLKLENGISIYAIIISLGLILLSLSCGKPESVEPKSLGKSNTIAELKNEVSSEKPAIVDFVDVPKLANRSSTEFDGIFGKTIEITKIKDSPKMMPGEYRLYAVSGHPKGLSVRFFNDKAKRFNLLLGTPLKSSNEAIFEIFRIIVGSVKPDKISEPLSEKWKGKFNGIDFVTVYAKREIAGGDFTMLHAEVAN